MIIPAWFLVLVIILLIARIFINWYLNKKVRSFCSDFIEKHLNTFDSTFTLCGKDLRFYYAGDKFILTDGNKKSK